MASSPTDDSDHNLGAAEESNYFVARGAGRTAVVLNKNQKDRERHILQGEEDPSQTTPKLPVPDVASEYSTKDHKQEGISSKKVIRGFQG